MRIGTQLRFSAKAKDDYILREKKVDNKKDKRFRKIERPINPAILKKNSKTSPNEKGHVVAQNIISLDIKV